MSSKGGQGEANGKFPLAGDSKCTDYWLMALFFSFYPDFEYRLTK